MKRTMAVIIFLTLAIMLPLSSPAQERDDTAPAAKKNADPRITVYLMLLRADWSDVQSSKQIHADLQALYQETLPPGILSALPVYGPDFILPQGNLNIYGTQEFVALIAWLQKHELVKLLERQTWAVDDDNPRRLTVADMIASKTHVDLPSNAHLVFERETVRLAGPGRMPNGEPWPPGVDPFTLVNPPNSKWLWSFGADDGTGPALEGVTETEDVPLLSARRVHFSFPKRYNVQEGLRIHDDCQFKFRRVPSDRIGLMHWFADSSEFRSLAQQTGQIPLVVIHNEGLAVPSIGKTDNLPAARPCFPQSQLRIAARSLSPVAQAPNASDDSSVPTTKPQNADDSIASDAIDIPERTMVVELQNIDAVTVAEFLQKLFPESEAKIVPVKSSNRLILEGSTDTLRQKILPLIRSLDQPSEVKASPAKPEGPSLDVLRKQSEAAEHQSALVARDSHNNRQSDGQSKDVAAIRSSVAQAFAAQQQLQRAELEELRRRLQSTEQMLNRREQLRDEIIERRVRDLLNPELTWESKTQAGRDATKIDPTSAPRPISPANRE